MYGWSVRLVGFGGIKMGGFFMNRLEVSGGFLMYWCLLFWCFKYWCFCRIIFLLVYCWMRLKWIYVGWL